MAGTLPQTNITQIQAGQACALAGKRLCTDTEWLRACRGPDEFIYPYGNDEILNLCNGGQPNPNGFLMTTGANSGCLSHEGTFDMVGNVGEWTADPAGTFRGGSFLDAIINGAGCLNIFTAHAVNHSDSFIGFRCCSTDEPIQE